MAAFESNLSPSRTQGQARSIQRSVVSIQPLLRLPLAGVGRRQCAANPGGGL
jgi:hypothetical protein